MQNCSENFSQCLILIKLGHLFVSSDCEKTESTSCNNNNRNAYSPDQYKCTNKLIELKYVYLAISRKTMVSFANSYYKYYRYYNVTQFKRSLYGLFFVASTPFIFVIITHYSVFYIKIKIHLPWPYLQYQFKINAGKNNTYSACTHIHTYVILCIV